MYHLLVSFQGWDKASDSLSLSRVFEYTDDDIASDFFPRGKFDVAKITSIPAIFTSEVNDDEAAVIFIGTIHKARVSGKDVILDYRFESDLPKLTNLDLKAMASELGISNFEFHRTHWAIKDVDLYKVLFRYEFERKYGPKVFRIEDNWTIDPSLLSVMMPFHKDFDSVFSVLKRTAKKMELDCLRADNIWENPAVIQDVFSLIYRSQIVVCDCTGRNPNVFYEAGIAHTLGREVILIAQSKDDIPFDLQHLRYVQYINSPKGRTALAKKLATKIKSVLQ